MVPSVSKASFYFIAPIRIIDSDAFVLELAQKKWQPSHSYNTFSVTKEAAAFLGWTHADDFPAENGEVYVLNRQNSGVKELASLNNRLVAINRKGEIIPETEAGVEMNPLITLHLAPGLQSGLAIMNFTARDITMEQAVNLNYAFHKTDDKQAVRIMRKPSQRPDSDPEEQARLFKGMVEQSVALSQILSLALPNNATYAFENEKRLITANCLLLDSNPRNEEVATKKLLTQMALAKNNTYALPADTPSKTFEIFDNIWAYSSIEGFTVVAFEQENNRQSAFIKNFLGTFEVSYLPNYLMVLLVDLIYTNALRNIDEFAVNLTLQDRLRSARLVLNLATSHYEHLNRLIENINAQFLFDKKYAYIMESIQARGEQIERENNIREENYQKNINLLIGIIGLGQVIFAVVELIGVTEIFGHEFSEGRGAWWFAMISCCVFMLLIAGALIYVAWGQRKHN